MRNKLKALGIPTPCLISISEDTIIEEYVEGGNLYEALADEEDKKNKIYSLAFQAGAITGRFHKAGYVFADNKSQNYLVNFEQYQYEMIEKGFRDGYISEVRCNFPYLYIVLRNILSFGFASNQSAMIQNMTKGPETNKEKKKN